MRSRFAALLVVLAASWAAQAPPAEAWAFCGVFPGHCPPPPAEVQLNPDGSVQVENPHRLRPLPRRSSGDPLYPRRDGHLWTGFSDMALDHRTLTPAELAAITAAMGGSFIRLGMFWPGVQPPNHRRAPDRRDTPEQWFWSRYDGQYRDLIRTGIRPLWFVMQTPRDFVDVHERGMRCLGDSAWYCHAEPARRSTAGLDGLKALERFSAEVARRYPLAAGLEYRNEPNNPISGCVVDTEAPPKVPAWRYAAGLRAMSRGVRAARPAMRVLGGALSNCYVKRYTWPYLKALLRHGAARAIDGLTFHPYDEAPGTGGEFVRQLNRLGAILVRRGHRTMRLFPGEVGVRTSDTVDQAFQSRRLLEEQYDRLDNHHGDIALSGNYDAFAFFTTIETVAPHTRGYGWLKRRDALFGQFQAKRAFCDARERFDVATPLPPYVRDCPTAP